MKASGNGAPEICVQNLLKTIRGEVPYERIKGIDRTLIDKPSETAATDLAADVEFLVETYEPRVQLSDSDLKALTAQAGDFELPSHQGDRPCYKCCLPCGSRSSAASAAGKTLSAVPSSVFLRPTAARR